MTDRPIFNFSLTEQRILEAKERFDADMLTEPSMGREAKLFLWREFLKRWHDDLRALSWRRYEVQPKVEE